MSYTSTVGKRVRSEDEMQDIACMTLHACQEAWHERSTHAEKQRREARDEIRDTEYPAVKCRVRVSDRECRVERMRVGGR